MPRFKVPVVSERPDHARKALEAATGVSWFGSSSSGGGEPHQASAGQRMTAILKGDSAQAVEQRVREVVGEHCEVGPAQQMGEPVED
jgi:hypothetical protein